uniref:CMP-sialic acid transporter 1-like isoform X2 n=1 Tax=Rhizophora mucronata TaxID=61149 RepID=A0A2P2JN75_RHIMU
MIAYIGRMSNYTRLVQFSIWLGFCLMISEVSLRMDHGGSAFSMDTVSQHG